MSTALPVLVLNASYEPIAICTAKRAITMWAKGVARVEETYDQLFYRSLLFGSVFLPSVVRLSHYRRVPMKKHTVSRRNIFLRDRHTCQYCAVTMPPGKLTLDHVLPRSRGGLSIWENLVACCHPCNHRKADRTPEEARIALLSPPRAMSLHTSRSLMRTMGGEVPTWRKYLYYEA